MNENETRKCVKKAKMMRTGSGSLVEGGRHGRRQRGRHRLVHHVLLERGGVGRWWGVRTHRLSVLRPARGRLGAESRSWLRHDGRKSGRQRANRVGHRTRNRQRVGKRRRQRLVHGWSQRLLTQDVAGILRGRRRCEWVHGHVARRQRRSSWHCKHSQRFCRVGTYTKIITHFLLNYFYIRHNEHF